MSAFKQNRENWVDIFPFEKKLGESVPADQVLVIDIAGGVGHRLRDFKLKLPGATGRAVLQDHAHVLPTAETSPRIFADLQKCGIETMAHDIFKPQPIQGSWPLLRTAVIEGECIARPADFLLCCRCSLLFFQRHLSRNTKQRLPRTPSKHRSRPEERLLANLD